MVLALGMNDRDNYEHHFGVYAFDQKVSLVDQKKWDPVKFKDNYLGLVSKFDVSDSDERIKPLEFDYESIDTYKVSKETLSDMLSKFVSDRNVLPR